MTKAVAINSPTILLIEDNLADQEMTRRALEQANNLIDLQVVEDGEQALDYLLRQDVFSDPQQSPRPHLIFLDLNLPKLSGLEVLRQLRQRPDLSHLPVIVLSTSTDEDDVLESYRHGANAFLSKPARFELFVKAMEEIDRHWFKIVRLPCSPD